MVRKYVVFLCSILAGCGNTPLSSEETTGGGKGDGATTGATDSGEETTDDCVQFASTFSDVAIATTNVPTVWEVTIQTNTVQEVEVEVEDGDGRVRSVLAETTDGLHHSAVVLGLHTASQYAVRASTVLSTGASACSEAAEMTTGTFPAGFPSTLPGTLAEGRTAGFHLVPLLAESTVSVGIFDENGTAVWGLVTWDAADHPEWTPNPDGGVPIPFNFRVRLDPLGRGVVTNTQGQYSDDPGMLVTYSWSGEIIDTVEFIGGHTDFALLPDGSQAMLGWDIQTRSGRRMLGDTVMIRSPDGLVTTIWNAFDQFDPDLGHMYPYGFTADQPPTEDWSHVNGLSYDPVGNALLFSVTEPSSVVNYNLNTGQVEWVLGMRSPFFDGIDASLIDWPHGVMAIDGGVLVFNRTHPGDPTTCSNAVDIAVDIQNRTATPGWSYAGASCLQNGFLGDAERLPNGNTIVTWSSYGAIEEVTPAGEVVFQLNTGIGAGFGFGVFASSLPGMLQ